MRIFIWHGYLLHGTGSNEYTRALARTLARQGHDVTVFCQDPDTLDVDLGGAHVVRPELPGRLPVFVLDRYPDLEPALLGDFRREELDAFVAANARAMRDHGPADLLIANHVLMGAPVAAASGLPSLVKAHGSELEYAMRGNRALCQSAAQSLQECLGVVAGSEHIKGVVMDLVGTRADRITVIPPASTPTRCGRFRVTRRWPDYSPRPGPMSPAESACRIPAMPSGSRDSWPPTPTPAWSTSAN